MGARWFKTWDPPATSCASPLLKGSIAVDLKLGYRGGRAQLGDVPGLIFYLDADEKDRTSLPL